MENILVSGATGLLGAHLAAVLLQKGHKVRLIRRRPLSGNYFQEVCGIYGVSSAILDERLEWKEADIRNREALDIAMEGIDVVFHCAAMVSFWNKRHKELMDVNVTGTANMVNSALEAGVSYFGHVSSIAALGRATPGETLNEQSQWTESKYNTVYAKSKYLSEVEVWRGFAEGLKGSIINPGVILGEGRWDEGSLKIVKSAAMGFPFYSGGKNGYVDVQDCVKAMIMLWENKVFENRYVLVAGSYSLKEILSKLAAHFGKKAPRILVPSGISVPAGHLLQIWSNLVSDKEPFLSPETAQNSDIEFLYENKKIRGLNHFEFNDIEATLQRVASYFQAAKAGI